MCGALPCKPNKIGCVSGCANDAPVDSPKTDEKESAQSTSEATFMEEPIRDFTQKVLILQYVMCYDGLISRLEKLASRGEKPSNMVNLLSMDGGGIRGLVILQILMAIEKELKEPVFPYFDWVAGTSTGALLATGLAQGKTLRECQHIYLRFKDFILDGWSLPYNGAVVEQFMKDSVGEESLKEIVYPSHGEVLKNPLAIYRLSSISSRTSHR
ncbi:unnamed protein product, partial [Strongylus vulgaris]